MSGEEAVQNLCISCGNAALYFYKLFLVSWCRMVGVWAIAILFGFCEEDGRLSYCDFPRSTNEAKYANLSWSKWNPHAFRASVWKHKRNENLERSHSGLVRRTRNAVRSQGFREFESLPLRQKMSSQWWSSFFDFEKLAQKHFSRRFRMLVRCVYLFMDARK